MRDIYSVETIRAAEEATGELLASGVLMQRAASGLASAIMRELRGPGRGSACGRLRGRRVLVAVGSGNNGGDALWAAVRLLRRGVRVSAWRCGSRVHEQGWDAFVAAGGRDVDAVGALGALPDADLVVAGVLGIGGRAGLRPEVALFADACADAGVPVVAVDLPSGLEADACRAEVSFRASLTVTFGGLKACHVLEPARTRCGRVEVVDIGLHPGEPMLRQWEPADLAAAWPAPGPTSDKYSRGVVGIDTGSKRYPGAAVLSTGGAVHAGAGMVRYLGSATEAVVAAFPNVVTASGRVQAHLIGSGWGDRADGPEVVSAKLDDGVGVVVDADAIALVKGRRLGRGVLLTPHAGELARLLGVDRSAVEAEPAGHARWAASETGATVLLKGATQYVATPDGNVTLAVPGPAWTAQAGSGDTLAGIAGALLAAGLSARDAALAGASIQAEVAHAFPGPLPPQELAQRIGQVVGQLLAVARDR